MKILVIGKNGQLGKSIHKSVTNNEQTDEFVFVGREELDLSSHDYPHVQWAQSVLHQ